METMQVIATGLVVVTVYLYDRARRAEAMIMRLEAHIARLEAREHDLEDKLGNTNPGSDN